MSDFDWRKLKLYIPVIAAVIIIAAVLLTDIAIGGPDKAEVQNLAPSPEEARATADASPYTPAPYVPPPTETPTPGPTPISPEEAQARDQQRIRDLISIAQALQKYHDKEGAYPSTNDNIQSLCVFRDLDALCALEEYLDPLPVDPLGDPLEDGYWYKSDGKTFMLIAAVDLPSNSSAIGCDPRLANHQGKTLFYCLTSD